MDLIEFSEWKARMNDPATSQIAAQEVATKLVGLRADFVCGLRLLGGRGTANEVAVAVTRIPTKAESIRKRAKELVEAGVIRVIGDRECMVSGKRAQVYERV